MQWFKSDCTGVISARWRFNGAVPTVEQWMKSEPFISSFAGNELAGKRMKTLTLIQGQQQDTVYSFFPA